MRERDGQETQDAPADCYKMRRTQLFTDVPRWAAFAKFNFESEDGGSREDGEMFLNCIIYNTNGWDSRKSQFQSKYTAEINGGGPTTWSALASSSFSPSQNVSSPSNSL
jgi:hypothetical protein